MADLLLLIHGLMKIGLVIGVMVLVATWPRRSSASGTAAHQGGLLCAGLVDVPTANRYVHTTASAKSSEFDDDAFAGAGTLLEPIGPLATIASETDPPWPDPLSRTHEDRWMDSNSDRFEPAFNIDGTMMLGDFDANGNMYGVTDSHFDSWDSATSSIWDD
ncbi:hypothetical protein ENE75_23995 [Rubrivivax albus]|uniref:Uncharacterized protein n=2 Tax=Rubrivivax albus TaxID=2499835 RepID=A0A437JLQ1_9BURK|nr:hypothetical protein ENE75_23995 [Rubrivivax albus]